MSLSGYILSIDQGTTSSRALILNELGQILAQKNIEFKQYYPENGWVEHDPVEILKTTTDAIKQVLAELKINAQDVVVVFSPVAHVAPEEVDHGHRELEQDQVDDALIKFKPSHL